ncbi:MAG TPA: hypothetical protein VE465_11410 [Streptosporangiaceae bacterium]|nr:hypothetical protein [Streptosporangiaceae bacterium]
MASKVILHIGVQKSGTTFLQHMLQDNNDLLAAEGVCYPISKDWSLGRRSVANHEWSSYGLLGAEYPWVTAKQAAAQSGSWQALLEQVHAEAGTVLLSAEALSVIREPAIGRVMDALGADDVQVVITARNLARSLASLWQQHVRNGRSTSFNSYLENLAEQRGKGRDHIEHYPDAHVWRAFILSGLVRRWSQAGASRVHLVTTPGKPPDLLWHRFAQAVGRPGLAQFPVEVDLNRRGHTGLTAPEILVLASLNAAVQEVSRSKRNADRLRKIITEGFQSRERRGGQVMIPPEWRPRVAEWSAEDLADLSRTDVHVVGDIDDLRYDPDREQPATSTPEETGRAAAAAILALAEQVLSESLVRRLARRVRKRLLPR